MSTAPTPATPPTPTAYPPSTQTAEGQEIRIVSHSNIFYWWPVWAFGFLMAIITYSERTLAVIVPHGTVVNRETIVLPPCKPMASENPNNKESPPAQPHIHMTNHQTLGVIFVTVLLLVIVITNVPLRGMWSLIVIISVILLALILHLANLTDVIRTYANYLDIRINGAGYLFVSTVLFLIWFATVMFFDQRVYIIFGARQLRVCTEIGSGEKVYDAMGLALEKQQSDWFRHWLLGMGAGDLVVKTSGAQAHTFDLPNVLFIRAKIRAIERLMQRQVVQNR
jgi:hypothetical protein